MGSAVWSRHLVNVPNSITVARLGLTVGVIACLQWVDVQWSMVGDTDPMDGAAVRWSATEASLPVIWVGFVLFVVAAATDYVDGYLARKWGIVTAFGRVADPFADKVLTCGTMVMLLRFDDARDLMPAWVVTTIIAREFLVTAIRGLAESKGVAFPADRLGKWKMVAQCLAIGSLFTVVAGVETFRTMAAITVWAALALAVISGAGYCYKGRKVILADGT